MKWVLVMCLVTIHSWSNEVDPFMPPWMKNTPIKVEKKATEKKKEQFFLRQIVMHDKSRRAVINGYVVKEGDYIKNARVNHIGHNFVELVRGNKKWKLNLGDSIPRVRR